MNTTIIRTNRRKTTSKGMRTLITLKPVKKKVDRDMPKRVQISINIEDCVSQNRRVVSCSLRFTRRLHEENHLRFSNSKHFRFYWTKKHFISAWYFTNNHEIGSLVVRTIKKSWDSRQNRELRPASRNCWSFRHVYRLDESKSFKSS